MSMIERTPFHGRILGLVRLCLVMCLLPSAAFALDLSQRLNQLHHTSWTAKDGLKGSPLSLAQTADGFLWIGTTDGLFRFDGVSFERFRPQGGELPALSVSALLGVPDGGLWVGYTRGRASFISHDGRVANYSAAGSAHLESPPFARTADGAVWAAVIGGLARFDGTRWQKVRMDWNYPCGSAWRVFVDRQGTLWVAAASPNGIYFLPKGTRKFQDAGLRGGVVAGLRQAPDGRVLVMDDGEERLYVVPGGDEDPRDLHSMAKLEALQLTIDRDGTVRATGNRSVGSVSGIVVVPSGVWLSTSSGIVHVPEREFQEVSRDPEYRVNYEVFDQVTDLPEPLATRTSGEPAAAGSDGVLGFVTTNGVARVDPRRIARNPLPPPVVIRSVIADDRAYSPHDVPVALPALTKTIGVDYSGLSLSIPERVKFRYRLEGWESEWHDADTRRTAFYTPGPGRYGFHVVASNNDGVWNEIGATLAFTVAPAWFQTLWFKALVVLSIGVLLLLLYRIRVRQVAAALAARFEAQLAERTRIAQDLHDTLLQSTAAALMHVQLAGGELTGDSRSTMSARDRALPSLERATQILWDVNAEGRAAVQGLRARSAAGDLGEALGQVCLDQPNGRDVDHRVTVQGSVRALRPPVSEEVYRIAHEALVNAYQHANARRIDVDLAYARAWFRCVVRDDGRGIDAGVLQRGRERHWGLTGMRERAQRVGGDLEVRSVADGGTEVEFRIRDVWLTPMRGGWLASAGG